MASCIGSKGGVSRSINKTLFIGEFFIQNVVIRNTSVI